MACILGNGIPLQKGGDSERQDWHQDNDFRHHTPDIGSGFAWQGRLQSVQKSNECSGLVSSGLRSQSALHKPNTQRRSWGGGNQQTADNRERDQYPFHIYYMALLSPKENILRGHRVIHKRCIVFDKDARFSFQGIRAVTRRLLNNQRG